MTTPNKSDENEFFQLAAKKLGGLASAEETARLEACVHRNPGFRKAFEHMQALAQSEQDNEFLQTAIRVILKMATPEESKKSASWKTGDPARWRRFQFMQAVFDGFAREAALGDTTQKTAMPERVRSALASKLKEVRGQKRK